MGNGSPPTAGETFIRTPDQRLRVFVSSTLQELREERDAARRAIITLRLTPVLFEHGARPHPPRALYRAYLEQSHVFVGIYWQRYGWIAPDMDISGLEDEYRLAADKPRLIYIRQPAPERDPRLAALLEGIEHDGQSSYKSFRSPSELRTFIEEDLAVLLSERFEAIGEPAPTARPRSVGLPAPASRFIGREREVEELRHLLQQEDVRLVTLTGPGGIGKSRLALEVAAAVRGAFRHDVSVVTLDSLPSAAMVALAIQEALGLTDMPGRDPSEVLRMSLREREMLLVLDNFETVIEAAPLVADLLAACPDLKALVTSREVLRVSGEHVFEVPPLAVPESAGLPLETLERSEAVRLFADRAQAVSERFRLDETNASAVAEISRRLEGVPLAIELAAARTRMLPPAAILPRLDSHLEILTGGPRDAPERHRTLRGTIDWSYELLEKVDQALLARLGVFVGGWTLDAAEAVCGDAQLDALEAMASLIDRSLVRPGGFSGDTQRFAMLETMREYALERLGERGEIERRRRLHADYFLSLAEKAAAERTTAPLERWVESLAAESGNIRAAARWLLDRPAPGRAARMGWALWGCWWLRWHLPEAIEWMEEVLTAEDALSTEERMMASFVLGVSSWALGDDTRSIPLLREAYALAQHLEDPGKVAGAQVVLGVVIARSGGFEEGEELLRQALATYRALEDPWATAYAAEAVFGFGQVMQVQGRSEESLPLLEETVDRARGAGETMVLQIALTHLGQARLGVSDPGGAKAALLESLKLADGPGDRGGSPSALDTLAAVALGRGDPKRGAMLLGAAEGARRSIGRHDMWTLSLAHERTERELRAALGDERFTATFNQGVTLTAADALRVAREL
jgi:predicted ATPase